MPDDDLKIKVSAPGVKRTEQDLKGVASAERKVGKEAKRTGDQAKRSFGSLKGIISGIKGGLGSLLGAGIGFAGLIAVMRTVYQISADIARAQWDIYRAEQARMAGRAQAVSTPLSREVRDITGWGLADIRKRSLKAAYESDISPTDYMEAVKPIWSRMPEGLREESLADAMKMAAAGGMRGSTAGGLPPLLYEQYGAKTPEAIRGGMARVRSVAKSSAYTTGQFAGILSRTGSSMTQAGLSLDQQLGYIAAYSLYAPDQPERTGTALEQMSSLSLRKNPYMEGLLKKAGKPADSKNLDDIRVAIVQHLRGGGDLQELQQATGMPFEILRQIQRAQTGAFEAKLAESLQAAGGAQWSGIAAEAQEYGGTQYGRMRRQTYGAELREMETPSPTSALSASQLIARHESAFRAQPGYHERATGFQTMMASRPEPLSKEKASELMSLNDLYGRVRWSLVQVKQANSGHGNAAVDAEVLIMQLDERHDEANNWQLFGDQTTEVDLFAAKIREAIEFLRRVGSGEPFAAKFIGATVTPTEGQIGAAGIPLGDLGMGTSGGGGAGTVIINNHNGGPGYYISDKHDPAGRPRAASGH